MAKYYKGARGETIVVYTNEELAAGMHLKDPTQERIIAARQAHNKLLERMKPKGPVREAILNAFKGLNYTHGRNM